MPQTFTGVDSAGNRVEGTLYDMSDGADQMHYTADVGVAGVERGMAQGKEMGGALAITFYIIGWLIVVSAFCVPLWQRVFMHPIVIKKHLERVLLFLLMVAVILVLGLVGFFGDDSRDAFVQLGIAGLVFGGLSYVLGHLQLALSERHPDKAAGNGYGILNLITLINPNFRPTHVLTVIQDIVIVAIFWFGFQPLEHIQSSGSSTTIYAVIVAVAVGLFAFGYTWYCQIRFSGIRNVLVPVSEVPYEQYDAAHA